MFINYGHHDNVSLFCEYGFTLPNNPYNNCVLDDEYFEYFDQKSLDLILFPSYASWNLVMALKKGMGLSDDLSMEFHSKESESFSLNILKNLCRMKITNIENLRRNITFKMSFPDCNKYFLADLIILLDNSLDIIENFIQKSDNFIYYP